MSRPTKAQLLKVLEEVKRHLSSGMRCSTHDYAVEQLGDSRNENTIHFRFGALSAATEDAFEQIKKVLP